MELAKEVHEKLYTIMMRIRLFEEKAIELFSQGMIPGILHPYVGEEAVAAGVAASLRDDDYVTGTHRGHGHCVAKGMRLDKMMAEILGKATGYNKGKGGSMHIADFSRGVIGCNGIVGGGISIATGAAWSSKLKGDGRVAVAFFGDGALNRGSFHEAANLAAVWRLPVVYVCENNRFAISVATEKAFAIKDLSLRAVAYGIEGIGIDGNDVIAVYRAAKDAVYKAREGGGPTLVVCNTCRHRGHEEGDPQSYRAKEDIEACRRNDPIARYEEHLSKIRALSQDGIKTIKAAIDKEVAEAVEFAINSPLPDPADALKDLFSGEI